MSRFLQLLLDAQEPMFSKGLATLEKTTGHSGVDIRLIADVTEKAHQIMRKLNLDVRDTTGRELYGALIATVKLGTCGSLLSDVDYVLIMTDGRVISFNLIDDIVITKIQFVNDTSRSVSQIEHRQRVSVV